LEQLGKDVTHILRTHTIGNVRIQTRDWRVAGLHADDRLYKKLPMWEALPRGFAELRILSPTTDEVIDRHVVVGLRKFGYEGSTFGEYGPPSVEAVTEHYSVKENGVYSMRYLHMVP